MVFTIATPVLVGEMALMLCLLIIGARVQPSAVPVRHRARPVAAIREEAAPAVLETVDDREHA
jgi:hypothetical protein